MFCCSLFFKVNMLDLFYRKFLCIRYSFWINKPMRCFAISFLRTAMFCYPFESNLSNLTVCRLANFHKFEFSFSNEVIIALSRLTFMREAHSLDHSRDFILCLFYFIYILLNVFLNILFSLNTSNIQFLENIFWNAIYFYLCFVNISLKRLFLDFIVFLLTCKV